MYKKLCSPILVKLFITKVVYDCFCSASLVGSALNIIIPLAFLFWIIRRSSGMMGVSTVSNICIKLLRHCDNVIQCTNIFINIFK